MSKRFRVAFSFAGEKRAYVAEVARILADVVGRERILYDKFHEAEFARSDLAFYLTRLYREDSDLIVAVLSPDYALKEWCGLEWSATYGVIKKRQAHEVMLTRFDLVEGEGLQGLAGFVDLDAKAPAEAAALILERLDVNEGRQRATPTGPEWPEEAPGLDWPVADHTEARGAFAKLITRGAPFRLLPVSGSSETGKSHLSKQFLGNALKIPNLTCGLLDFKGSTDMRQEVQSFAQFLGVATPTQSAVPAQLGEIFAMLQRASRPTLLVFDTFERAGEHERWVRDNLLPWLVRAPWLRVILMGQRVVGVHGEPWASISSPEIRLHPPNADEWFNYGREYKTGLTLDFVRQAHQMTDGKSAVLAQLLGPPSRT
jgi:hypothetical protein